MHKRIAAGSIAALVAVALVGCSAPTPAAPDDEPEVSTIRMATVPASTTFHAVIADEQGMFEANDIEVTINPLANLANAIPGLGSQYEVVYGTLADAVLAHGKGFDVAIISGSYIESEANQQVQLIAGKDSGITSVSDLAGKRIALPSLAGVIYAAMLGELEKAGVGADGATLVEVPFPNMIDQLNGGQVDAIFTTQPFMGGALAQGHTPIANPFLSVADPTLIGVWIATSEWANANPKAVENFRTAMQEAIDWAGANDAETRKMLTASLGIPEAVAAVLPFPDWTTEIKSGDLEPWIELLLDTEQITGTAPNPADLVFGAK